MADTEKDRWCETPVQTEEPPPFVELTLFAGRHGYITEYRDYNTVNGRGKWTPVSDLSDEERVITIATTHPKNGKQMVNIDIHTSGIYDECGYITFMPGYANTTIESWEHFEAVVNALGLTHFNRRVYMYCPGSPQVIEYCLMTIAGQHYPVQFDSSIPSACERWTERHPGKIDAYQCGKQTICLTLWKDISKG